jgi:hypothetical protein
MINFECRWTGATSKVKNMRSLNFVFGYEIMTDDLCASKIVPEFFLEKDV